MQELDDVIWLHVHVPEVKHMKGVLPDETLKDSTNDQSGSEDDDEEHHKPKKTFELEKNKNEGEVREYSLEDMSDLQSRLMLITGKADAGRESIERFTSVRKR